MKTYGVIMAGGGGTRFWPLSRHEIPKQLLNLSGKELMINETIDRVSTLCDKNDILIVTNVDQVPAMEKATDGRILPDHILSEPSARNTAACIGYAAFEIIKKYGDGIMCIFPADHYIKNTQDFTKTLNLAIKEAETGALITLGITPTFSCTGYGYIKFDNSEDGLAKKVVEFKEKPDLETAKTYVESGEYAWNSGMFVWKASTIIEEFKKYIPDIYEDLSKIADAMGSDNEKSTIEEIYPNIRSISIDYGIMEKSDKVKVISADMGWNDVGSWDNLGVLYKEDPEGNVFAGDHLSIDTTGCITYSQKRLISTIGVSDLIIVETDDAILVADKNRAQDVKQLVEELKQQGRKDLL